MDKAFIQIIDPINAEGTLKRAYKRIGGMRGEIAHVHQSQSLNPKAMLGHLDLYMALMYSESPLSRLQREMIGSVTSFLNKCEYCVVHHHEALKHHWNDAPDPEDLVNGVRLSTTDQVLVNHVIKLVRQPEIISEGDIKELMENGFDDRAILDITMITGYFCFVNRLTLGLGVSLETEDQRDYSY